MPNDNDKPDLQSIAVEEQKIKADQSSGSAVETTNETRAARTASSTPDKKLYGKRMNAQLYEACWLAWRDGKRSKPILMEIFDLSWPTANHIVEKGYPKQGWPSLRARALAFDKQTQQQQQVETMMNIQVRLDDWGRARADQLKLATGAKAALGQLLSKALEALRAATFTKQKKITDKLGNVTEVTISPSAFELADAVKTIANAIKEVGQHESLWLGGPTERYDHTASPTWLALTPEQLDHIAETGELPDGVTDEMLFGAITAPVSSAKN